MRYYLAIDIGASSGRHILSHIEGGRIVTEEIHRFANGNEEKDGHRVWNLDGLFAEIIAGMQKCAELKKLPCSMGIDTWGVDYALLDKDDKRVGLSYAYRDSRTEGMDEEVYRIIPEDKLYERTGIQKAIFNTIYQLMAVKLKEPENLSRAESLLLLPDYFNFLLTGVKKWEYTNASTTQLLSPKTFDWDYELINMLGFPTKLFGKLSMPGETVGELSEEIARKVGYSCKVILPATHDTGSAVISVPKEDTIYISSGTWSLMGCELKEAICTPNAKAANLTNEGGYDHRFRFLKNIMGLWMIQSVKKELEAENANEDYSFANLCKRAEEADISSIVDANDGRFLAPASMIEEIKAACRESGQRIPETPWELARVIYRSLAVCYKKAAEEIEDITGKHFDRINIVGGGSNAEYLNVLTAKETGKKISAGPSEATAIGNLGVQLIADGVYGSLAEFRGAVGDSFELKEY